LGLIKGRAEQRQRGGRTENKHSDRGEKNKTQKPDEEPELKKKNRAEIQSKKGTNSQREGEKGEGQHREESALLLSSSLQKKKNPKSVKKKLRESWHIHYLLR
jgi:hypothetical protein